MPIPKPTQIIILIQYNQTRLTHYGSTNKQSNKILGALQQSSNQTEYDIRYLTEQQYSRNNNFNSNLSIIMSRVETLEDI